jgi:hypothetical protein
MDSSSELRYRAWHRGFGTTHAALHDLEPIAWQVSTHSDKLLLLLDAHASALRSLATQLPPQDWTGVVLPAVQAPQPDLQLFLAQLGHPRLLDAERPSTKM